MSLKFRENIMDAFHKILVRIYEITGGRDSVDVDMVELTKKEGYFPSIDSITEMLKSESWVTESRPNTVRITQEVAHCTPGCRPIGRTGC